MSRSALKTCLYILTICLLYSCRLQEGSYPWQAERSQGLFQGETIELNGVQQYILIRSENIQNPVFLLLHGGPGFPTSPFAYHLESDLSKHFTVVHWDQRGAGKSFNTQLSPATMTMEQVYADAQSLIQYLHTRFKQEKIFLAGQSWGSFIGLKMAAQHPEWLYAYIGIAQIVDPQQGAQLSYTYLLNEAKAQNNHVALAELQPLGPPPHDLQGRQLTRRWLNAFGGFLHRPIGLQLAWIALNSPDYSWWDYWQLYQGLEFSNLHLVKTIQQHPPLTTQIHELKLPVYFIHGRHDKAVPGRLAYDFYSQIGAPDKAFFWFEDAAHAPNKEEPLHFQTRMIQLKKRVLDR